MSTKKGRNKMDLGQELINKIEEITITDYEAVNGRVSLDVVKGIIEDLLTEIDRLEGRNPYE